MKQLIAVVWWPHSGGRWLCRSILKKHSQVHETVFTNPILYYSTDMLMETDITAQVHKARSLPELKGHLDALVTSIDHGRKETAKKYFELISQYEVGENTIVGEICMGSPIPRQIDIDLLMNAGENIKVIHLVRSPLTSFNSFAKRHEMDSDPVKIAGSWVTLNYSMRSYFKQHPELADRYQCVKYEDLLSSPEETVKSICEFAGLDFEEGMLDSLKERWGRSTKSEIDKEIGDVIKDIAKPELDNYGY